MKYGKLLDTVQSMKHHVQMAEVAPNPRYDLERLYVMCSTVQRDAEKALRQLSVDKEVANEVG